VVGVPHERYGEEVLACVIPRDPADAPSLEDVRAFCEGRPAHDKIPARLPVLDAFPMTVSGKVRKAELRDRCGKQRREPRDGQVRRRSRAPPCRAASRSGPGRSWGRGERDRRVRTGRPVPTRPFGHPGAGRAASAPAPAPRAPLRAGPVSGEGAPALDAARRAAHRRRRVLGALPPSSSGSPLLSVSWPVLTPPAPHPTVIPNNKINLPYRGRIVHRGARRGTRPTG
jgi:hypothetical protein